MRVTVEYHGPAREAAGVASESLTTDAPSAHVLVTRLARERGGRLAALVLDGDRLSRSLLIAVNDAQANESTALNDGDVVSIIPPVSGGSNHGNG
jgi:molybdopterin converting factor small subunit